MARQAELLKEANTAITRLNAGDRAYKDGEIRIATRIYVSVARAAPRPVAVEARKRLDRLAEEARQKLQAIQDKFATELNEISPGDASFSLAWAEQVQSMFEEYTLLSTDYGGVPAAKAELKNHIARERRRPVYARVLNEPEAKALWDIGQQHEELDHLCCAFWVYKEAANLAPAASALLAKKRLDKLQEDPPIVAAAERCRDIQLCHKMYSSAERIIHTRPERAKELFTRIVNLAPEDTELYRAAYKRLVKL